MIKDLQAGDPALVGQYRMLGRLGAGGMGQVYLGRSPGGRLVAMKLIRPELAEERGFRARFASEITAAKNVSGIYTAAVVDADADAELPWMATVYVAGPSLTDAVEDHGPLPVNSVLALAGGLAEALGAIHQVGLVHRDLKPSNVLLASDGPRVIDFGISLALERSMLTTTGMVMGSPGFMSPEQARGQREVGAPTDVFSLGAVLAYAATGSNPFGGGPTPALLYRVVNEEPDLAGVPARLSPLIGQCLAKDPADRPTPAEVLELIGDDVGVLSGEWLPATITQTMNRYTPTLQTPLPSAVRDPAQPQAAPGAVSAGAGPPAPPASTPASASSAPATPAPAPAESAPSGPVGYEPTVLGPVMPAPGAPAPAAPASGAPAPVPATVAQRGVLPETALVPMSGAITAAGQGVPGGPGKPPPTGPSPLRRWRWPITVAAAAIIIVAVVAVLLTSQSHGSTPKVNPTASLAGETTKAPATKATSTARSASPTPTPTSAPTTQPTSQQTVSTPVSQQATTAAPTSSATSAPSTAAPTSTPTQSATSSPATASTAPTSAPTQAPTGASSAPTSNPTSAPTAPTSP